MPNRFRFADEASECASLPSDGVPCVERGRVVNWEMLEDAWHHLLYSQLGWEEGNEGPIFLSEPVLTSRVRSGSGTHVGMEP